MILNIIMSMSLEQLIIVAVRFLTLPVSILVLVILLLAASGKSLGIRRAYANWLLQIFEVSDIYLFRVAKTRKEWHAV